LFNGESSAVVDVDPRFRLKSFFLPSPSTIFDEAFNGELGVDFIGVDGTDFVDSIGIRKS
jgi:hypothetical protein